MEDNNLKNEDFGIVQTNINYNAQWTTYYEDIFVDWCDKAMSYRYLHSTCHRSYYKKHVWFTIPVIFISTLIFVHLVYKSFDKWTSWVAYVDTITTAIFFVGMWLMAKRKIENWIYWIIGDIISVPLYFYKGFTFTSFQYLIFTIIAIYGYLEWKKILNKKTITL